MEALYEKAVDNFKESCLREFYLKYSDISQRIILFGTKAKGHMMIKALKLMEKDHLVVAFCDNDKMCWRVIEGVKIVSPEETKKLYPDAIFIVCSIAKEAIYSQLSKMQALYLPTDRFDDFIDRILITDIFCTGKKDRICDVCS